MIGISGTGMYAADGMYTQTGYDCANKTPIFTNQYSWSIRYIGGRTCGGKWVLMGPGGIYAEWDSGDIENPPSGFVSITYLGLSENTYAGVSWSNCP